MRLIAFMLSVYVLLLSAMPCRCDGHDALPSNDNSMTTVIMEGHDCNDVHDSCTPFCICTNSCHTVNLYLEQSQEDFSINFSLKNTSFYNFCNYSAELSTSKKPPQA
jgi:hypothetical protein